MSTIKKIPITIISTALFIILPFVVLTLLTSRTSILFDIRSFVVQSGSMEPVFPVGSMVYAQKQAAYNVGDVITFEADAKRNITHRITAKTTKDNKVLYTTKGDANNVPDSAPVPQETIIGRVFFFAPHIGQLANHLKSPLYFIGLIIVPSLLFIFLELWEIKKEIVRSTEKRVLERLRNQQLQKA